MVRRGLVQRTDSTFARRCIRVSSARTARKVRDRAIDVCSAASGALPSVGRLWLDQELLLRGLLVILGYLTGSIPVGVLVARASGGPDPRTVGSGRTGGTNALRALGRKWALLVVAGDLAKGAVPVLIARIATGGDPVTEVLVAAAAVAGSVRSVFLGFSGGRGVGTGVGTMLVIQPLAVVLAAPVFFLAIIATRYVSLGSLLGSAAMFPATLLIWAVVGPILIWLAHADNIDRLLHGTERKFDLGLLGGRRQGGGA